MFRHYQDGNRSHRPKSGDDPSVRLDDSDAQSRPRYHGAQSRCGAVVDASARGYLDHAGAGPAAALAGSALQLPRGMHSIGDIVVAAPIGLPAERAIGAVFALGYPLWIMAGSADHKAFAAARGSVLSHRPLQRRVSSRRCRICPTGGVRPAGRLPTSNTAPRNSPRGNRRRRCRRPAPPCVGSWRRR